MRRTVLALSTAVVLMGSLAACGGGDNPDGNPTTSSTRSADLLPGTTDVPTVTGAFGQSPTIVIPQGESYDGDLYVKVLQEGDGQKIAEGDITVADYQAWLWKATLDPAPTTLPATPAPKQAISDTFASGMPEPFTVAEGKVLKGIHDGLVGVPTGSRVLAVLPPDAAFGEEGRETAGIGPDDTLVFVFDLLGTYSASAEASGTDVPQDPAMPQVSEGDDGPTIIVPKTEPPTELVTKVLIKGDGPAVQAGQLVPVQYRGVLWKDGSEFDSSYAAKSATAFQIGAGAVIAGWDKGIVGQTVGSRVLLIVPPKEGYGEAGSPPKIAGDDTLVFVIDILGAYGNPKQPSATPTG